MMMMIVDDGWKKLQQGAMTAMTFKVTLAFLSAELLWLQFLYYQILLSEMTMRRKGGRRKHELFSHEARFSK